MSHPNRKIHTHHPPHYEGTIMPDQPQTELASWTIDHTGSVHDWTLPALGEWTPDFDLDGLQQDVRDAVNDNLPDGCTLHGDAVHGDRVYGPASAAADLPAAVAAVPFWDLAREHEARIANIHRS